MQVPPTKWRSIALVAMFIVSIVHPVDALVAAHKYEARLEDTRTALANSRNTAWSFLPASPPVSCRTWG